MKSPSIVSIDQLAVDIFLVAFDHDNSQIDANLSTIFSFNRTRNDVVSVIQITGAMFQVVILPSFNKLSNKFPKLAFVYADIDECLETTQHIRRYTIGIVNQL